MASIKEAKSRLEFDVAAPPRWAYAAGDTIIGNLVRQAPIVCPEALVELSLFGFVRTRITRLNGNTGRGTYRGQYTLLASSPAIIYRGPLHLPENSDESLSWPFEIRIPTEPLQSVRNHKQETSFLPLETDHPAHHVLPGTFHATKEGVTHSFDGSVEYYLKATLKYTFKTSKCYNAIQPITIRHPVPYLDAEKRYATKKIVMPRSIQTQRLIPGMENADLSLKDKALKLFGSSKVPEFHYNLELDVPLVLQLDDPRPLRVLINIVPIPDKTSGCIQDKPCDVQINWVKMIVQCKTMVLAPSEMRLHFAHSEQNSLDLDLHLPHAFHDLETPLVISTGKGNKPVDLGNMLQLRLRSDGLYSGSRCLAPALGLYPDFTTYSVRHSHMQKWVVCITVAGETRTIQVCAVASVIGMP
ncbi:uncharacterized protein N7459_009301 [Penicillium hispanicum]|uniref:uncharacterized protein n=1 Tax=Penicillium hispanicum TaxID=1080232 RepID=UPI00253FB58D|nr:uncharacterized protein N7459_009301 [Penicillium hispanicum]KAJ5569871.1 hypothetical protein N7459_009301 [Penicillium hispanicum]